MKFPQRGTIGTAVFWILKEGQIQAISLDFSVKQSITEFICLKYHELYLIPCAKLISVIFNCNETECKIHREKLFV